MKNKEFLSMLGLSARARGLAFGEGAVRDGVRGGRVKLVILSCDASDNTKKRIQDCCKHYAVPCLEIEDRFTLGKATGKELAVVMGVRIDGIAQKLLDIWANTNTDAL